MVYIVLSFKVCVWVQGSGGDLGVPRDLKLFKIDDGDVNRKPNNFALGFHAFKVYFTMFGMKSPMNRTPK